MKVVIALLCCLLAAASAKTYCTEDQACWPSMVELLSFQSELKKDGDAMVAFGDDLSKNLTLTFNYRNAFHPSIVARVDNKKQIQTALAFVRKHNIRLSILSSGHSFFGRCGADGSLQLVITGLKTIETELDCEINADGCMVVGAGVTWGEAYRAADRVDRVVVGGSNPTVSVSGWTLGGGHSPLSRMFGLGVHNTLGFEMVLWNGTVAATNGSGIQFTDLDGQIRYSTDSSLFWALRGGGSAFGVLTKLQIKMHQPPPGGMLQMICDYTRLGVSEGVAAVRTVMTDVSEYLADAPRTVSGYIIPGVGCNEKKQCAGGIVLSLLHFGDVGHGDDEIIRKTLALPHKWKGLKGTCSPVKYKSFYQYELSIPNSTYTNAYITGGLVPSKNFGKDYSNLMADYMQKAYEVGRSFGGTAIIVGGAVGDVAVNEVSVHPGWKDAVLTVSLGHVWDPRIMDGSEGIKLAQDFQKASMPYINGMYYNEAPDDMSPAMWKEQFWGSSIYGDLVDIKKRFDPTNMFTCASCLGSDWDEDNTADPIG